VSDALVFEYDLPERLATSRAHSPLNVLMTKMNGIGLMTTTWDRARGTQRVKVRITDQSKFDKARKINAQIRSLLATGGE
jgi:hypothetical protein